MTFRDPILGGNELVRTAMQSENYAAGTTGWRIARDGTVEFNSGTFRGSLEVGSDPGQHFIVANTTTGDVVDVYDSANHLIYAITNQGLAASYSAGTAPQPYAGFQNAKLLFSDNATPTEHQSTVNWSAATVPAGQGTLTILNSGFVSDVGALEILCGSADGTKRPTVQAIERGKQGSIVVTDQVSTNNLMRLGHFTGTTGASGVLSIANAASFNIAGAVVLFDQTSVGAGVWCGGAFNYGSTTLNTQWLTGAGATFNNSAVKGTYIAWG